MMKLVEECAGDGDLMLNGERLRRVQYSIRRYQGVVESSGLPVPGVHRIEGAIDLDENTTSTEWIGATLALRLEDGRLLGITLVSADGRILSEGHGPSKCRCC